MKKIPKAIVFGALTWAIPFGIGFLLFQVMLTYKIFYKTIMLLTGSAAGIFFSILYFKELDADFLKESIIFGLIIFAINIGLDMIFLLPLMYWDISAYFLEIGLRYLNIMIFCFGIGQILILKNVEK